MPGLKVRDPPSASMAAPLAAPLVPARAAKETRPNGTQVPAASAASVPQEDSEDGASTISGPREEEGQDENGEQSAGASGGEASRRAPIAPEDEETEGPAAIELPEGFFDDP